MSLKSNIKSQNNVISRADTFVEHILERPLAKDTFSADKV